VPLELPSQIIYFFQLYFFVWKRNEYPSKSQWRPTEMKGGKWGAQVMDPLRCPVAKQKAKDWILKAKKRRMPGPPAEQRKRNGKRTKGSRNAAKPHTLNCIFNCFGAKGQDSGDGGVLQADGFGYNCQWQFTCKINRNNFNCSCPEIDGGLGFWPCHPKRTPLYSGFFEQSLR